MRKHYLATYPRERLNERESGGVKYWNTTADPGNKNRHAEYDGVEFFAFPYQTLSAREGNLSAHVSDRLSYGYADEHIDFSVRITEYRGQGVPGNDWYGDSKTIGWQKFPTQDAAIIWAVGQIKGKSNAENNEAGIESA